jgi:acylphosphatase
MDFDVLKRVLAALESRGVKYAIFGAIALNLHGIVRNTEDLDIFVAPEEANIDLLKAALRDAIDDPEIEDITARDLLGDVPAVRYVPPNGSFYIDILTRLGEAFAFADLDVQRVAFDDLTVSVVTPRTLYNMKKDTVRAKDRLDADLLQRTFNLERD